MSASQRCGRGEDGEHAVDRHRGAFAVTRIAASGRGHAQVVPRQRRSLAPTAYEAVPVAAEGVVDEGRRFAFAVIEDHGSGQQTVATGPWNVLSSTVAPPGGREGASRLPGAPASVSTATPFAVAVAGAEAAAVAFLRRGR